MSAAAYECYGGPLDGATQAIQYEGQWWFIVPLVAGRYVLASGLSGANGRDLGPHWFWRPSGSLDGMALDALDGAT